MREIRFRAWDKNTRYMAKSFLPDWGNINQERYILMQYTGLKDKNGKEIYEGDVVKFTPTFTLREVSGVKEFKSAVYYSPGGFFVQSKNHFGGIPIYKGLHIEVIGNVYENPGMSNTVDAGKKNE